VNIHICRGTMVCSWEGASEVLSRSGEKGGEAHSLWSKKKNKVDVPSLHYCRRRMGRPIGGKKKGLYG